MSFLKRRWIWVLILLLIIMFTFHSKLSYNLSNEQSELLVPDVLDKENNILFNIDELRFIGIKDGCVAIYSVYCEEKVLKKVTGIKVSELPERDREYLKKGITVDSQEELLAVLDGLISGVRHD